MNRPNRGHKPTAQPPLTPAPLPPPPASPPPPDAHTQAVLRVAEDLTTQVRRIADALTTPVAVIRDGVTTPLDDATKTCGASAVTTFGPIGPCTLRAGHTGPVHKAGQTTFWRDEQAPAADEDAQRTTDEEQTLRFLRRESLLVLLTRLQRGRTLTATEADALRQHVETEIGEADTARAVAAGNKRHVQVMYAELEQAQAAIERVRVLTVGAAQSTAAGFSDYDIGRHELAVEVYTAIDGPTETKG